VAACSHHALKHRQREAQSSLCASDGDVIFAPKRHTKRSKQETEKASASESNGGRLCEREEEREDVKMLVDFAARCERRPTMVRLLLACKCSRSARKLREIMHAVALQAMGR
jgi:hypothetical protein